MDGQQNNNTAGSDASDTATTATNPPKIHQQPQYSTTERVLKDVPPPLWEYLPKDQVFDAKGMPILENLKQHFLREGRLNPEDARIIIQKATEIFRKEPNLLTLQDPITVCGDVHGQFFDLVKLFDVGGDPSAGKYIFLGDYVDRGYFASEVCLYLLSMKIHYPDTFYMLRGNHECRHLTAYFNFKHECNYKYNMEVYDSFMTCFDCLPLAAILNNKFLCVHGGLSPDIQTVDEINKLDRFKEPPTSGPMCDLLWSDPMEPDDEEKDPSALFVYNELRGCSYNFSYKAVCNFLRNNNLLSVIRAHEAQDEGYRLYKKSVGTGFPSVICIFSAPNYCDVYGNKGAIIKFQNNLMNIRQFNCSPHPYFLPNFMNAFDWSLPFVAEKIADMFTTIIALCDDEDEEEDEEDKAQAAAAQNKITEERGQAIRAKIRAMGRMARMYKTLREETETIVQLKGLAGGQIPKGLLVQGPEAVRNAVNNFDKAKKMDSLNEKRPPIPAEESGKQ